MRERLGLAVVLAVVIGAWPAAAQTVAPQTVAPQTAAGTPAFRDTVDVRLVNVEVWVTDRRGEPVTGLDAGDFEVREDGKRVAISNFAEIRAPAPAAPFAPPASSPACPVRKR